jgi:hypothetical protein
MRRVKEARRAGLSSSSIALSSIESDCSVEMLLRRPPKKGEICVGDVPDRPRVEMDTRRRCWSCAAAVEIGPGKGAVGWPVLFDRPKMELNVWVVKEPRRFCVAEGGVFSVLDMVMTERDSIADV